MCYLPFITDKHCEFIKDQNEALLYSYQVKARKRHQRQSGLWTRLIANWPGSFLWAAASLWLPDCDKSADYTGSTLPRSYMPPPQQMSSPQELVKCTVQYGWADMCLGLLTLLIYKPRLLAVVGQLLFAVLRTVNCGLELFQAGHILEKPSIWVLWISVSHFC